MVGNEKNQPPEEPVLVGNSDPIREVRDLIAKAAPSDILVLLSGESGSGKSLVANCVHRLSPRRDGPLLRVNCAGLTETLLDSELFGHERGAFTGADRRHAGKFELAHGGTLFLDEVDELSPRAQAKLLNVIEEGTLHRVGGEDAVRVDVRLIVAANRDLDRLVRQGAFRRDLFFRLGELAIQMPPLRERPADIRLLVEHFVPLLSREFGKKVRSVSGAAMAQLVRYDWPGNVRELRNVLKSGIATASHDQVWIEDLPLAIEMHTADASSDHGLATLEAVERQHVERVLVAVNWKKVDAAGVLGITRATLDRKIAKHKLQRPPRE